MENANQQQAGKTLEQMLAEMQARLDGMERDNLALKEQNEKLASQSGAGGFAGVKVVARLLGEKYKSGTDGALADGKGNVGAYGLARMPSFYYPEQWLAIVLDEPLAGTKLPAIRKAIFAAIRQHADKLAWKRPEVKAAFLASDLGK